MFNLRYHILPISGRVVLIPGGGGEGVVGDVDHHLLQVFSHEQLRAGGVQYNA